MGMQLCPRWAKTGKLTLIEQLPRADISLNTRIFFIAVNLVIALLAKVGQFYKYILLCKFGAFATTVVNCLGWSLEKFPLGLFDQLVIGLVQQSLQPAVCWIPLV